MSFNTVESEALAEEVNTHPAKQRKKRNNRWNLRMSRYRKRTKKTYENKIGGGGHWMVGYRQW